MVNIKVTVNYGETLEYAAVDDATVEDLKCHVLSEIKDQTLTRLLFNNRELVDNEIIAKVCKGSHNCTFQLVPGFSTAVDYIARVTFNLPPPPINLSDAKKLHAHFECEGGLVVSLKTLKDCVAQIKVMLHAGNMPEHADRMIRAVDNNVLTDNMLEKLNCENASDVSTFARVLAAAGELTEISARRIVRLYVAAANAGDAAAMFHLADMLQNGMWVKQAGSSNGIQIVACLPDTAQELFKHASEAGCGPANIRLADAAARSGNLKKAQKLIENVGQPSAEFDEIAASGWPIDERFTVIQHEGANPSDCRCECATCCNYPPNKRSVPQAITVQANEPDVHTLEDILKCIVSPLPPPKEKADLKPLVDSPDLEMFLTSLMNAARACR